MHRKTKLLILLVLIYTALIGIVVFVVLLSKNERQLPRRLFQHAKPCPFGRNEPYTIVEHHIPSRDQPPQFLFSTCLFGKVSPQFERDYIQPFLQTAQRIRTLMPEAQVRIYVAQALRDAVWNRLVEHNIEIQVVSPDSKGFEGTLWRFFPADEDLPFMSMDMDPDVPITPELVQKLRRWLHQSKKSFFVMRTGWHVLMPITAGRLACKPKALPFKIKEKIETYCDTNFGVDEAFLNREVWPVAKDDVESDENITAFEVGALTLLAVLGMMMTTSLYWTYRNCEETSVAPSSRRKT